MSFETQGNTLFGGIPGFDVTGLSGPVLRDTVRLSQQYPPIARCGAFGISTWPIGCDTPLPLSEPSPPLESMRSRGAIMQNGCDTPSAILSRKGIAGYGGGCLALSR